MDHSDFASIADWHRYLEAVSQPMLTDLRSHGFVVDDVDQLTLLSEQSPAVENPEQFIALLLKHLNSGLPFQVRSSLAQNLDIPEAATHIGEIINVYRASKESEVRAILAGIVGDRFDESSVDDVIRLALDESGGSERINLIRGLERSNISRAEAAARSLRSSRSVSKAIDVSEEYGDEGV